jgi:glycosyltransferase involved in cell wall biosynthesis
MAGVLKEKQMNIFADEHHVTLYKSLHLLFENRLGHNLFRPVGVEWFDEGFWKIAEPYGNHPATIKQYLSLAPEDQIYYWGTPPLNIVNKEKDGYYEVKVDGYVQKAVTLEQFKNMKFDIIIATIPAHIEPYKKLIKLYQPQAKFIFQEGNCWHMDRSQAPNLLSSTKKYNTDSNALFYHQEFDLNDFSFESARRYNRITNLVHLFRGSPEALTWDKYKQALPEYEWRMHGIEGDDGVIQECLAETIKDTTFLWHLKIEGDGFGHVIHNAFACGRPPIVRKRYYEDKLAGELMEDLVTCVDLDKRSFEDNIKVIKEYSQPDKYDQMSKNAYNRFKEIVDYDKEQKQIEEFLKGLV